MKEQAAGRAAELVRACRVAALATLHDGAPSVSMVPYALAEGEFAFLVLVSRLSSHTRDMQDEPRVGLMIVQPEAATVPAHALARISMQCDALPIPAEDPRHAGARAAYANRFPDMAMLFDLGDFGLFALRPRTVRVVAGFAQAASISPGTLAEALSR